MCCLYVYDTAAHDRYISDWTDDYKGNDAEVRRKNVKQEWAMKYLPKHIRMQVHGQDMQWADDTWKLRVYTCVVEL